MAVDHLRLTNSHRLMVRHWQVCAFILLVMVAVARAADSAVLKIESSTGVHPFHVELADTDATRSRGLMFRTTMPDDAGMLFVYDGPREILMWMKNTPLSLDMLFIDQVGMIKRIAANTTPYSTRVIPSGPAVKYVLEINGGIAGRLGIKVGDIVRHPSIAQ